MDLSPEILKMAQDCGSKLCTGLCELIKENGLTPIQASAVACNITVMMFTMVLASGTKDPVMVAKVLFPAMQKDTIRLIEEVSHGRED